MLVNMACSILEGVRLQYTAVMMYWFTGMRRLRAEIAPVDSHTTSQAVGVDVYMGKAGGDGGCTHSNCRVQGLTTGIMY